MPFRSYRQQAYMFMHHPKIAERWAHKYGTLKKPKGYKSKRSAVKRKLNK